MKGCGFWCFTFSRVTQRPEPHNSTIAQYMYHMYIVIVYQRVIRELLLQDELEFFAFQDWDLGPGKHGIPAQEIWVISQRA